MRSENRRLLSHRFPEAPPPRPGLAAELPAVALGLHELGAIAESGPYLGDGGDVVAGKEAQEALLDLPGEQRLGMPGEYDCGLLLDVRAWERGEQDLAQARSPVLL